MHAYIYVYVYISRTNIDNLFLYVQYVDTVIYIHIYMHIYIYIYISPIAYCLFPAGSVLAPR